MTTEELVREVCRRGVTLWVEEDYRRKELNIGMAPSRKVPPALRAELKARKAEVIEYFKTLPRASSERLSELEQKRRKLEAAGITTIAILDDGTMRVCRTRADVRQAVQDGAATYTPEDMYYRAQLSPQEQLTLHEVKRAFGGGSTEWLSPEETARRRASTIPARDDYHEWPDFPKQPQPWRCSRCKAEGEGVSITEVIEEHNRRSPKCIQLCVTLGTWRDIRKKGPNDDDGIRYKDEEAQDVD